MQFLRYFENSHLFPLTLVILEIGINWYSLQCYCDSYFNDVTYNNKRPTRSFKFPEETAGRNELLDNVKEPTEVHIVANVSSSLEDDENAQIQWDKGKTFLDFLKKDKEPNEGVEFKEEKIVTSGDNKYNLLTGSIKRLDIHCPPCQVYTTNGCRPNLFSFDSDFDEACIIYSSSSLAKVIDMHYRYQLIIISILIILFNSL